MPRIRKPKKPYIPSVGGLCPDGVDPYAPLEPQEFCRRAAVAQEPEPEQAKHIAQAAPAFGGPAYGPSCQVTVKIEKRDEDHRRIIIETELPFFNAKDAVRFIRRHTGYDPLA